MMMDWLDVLVVVMKDVVLMLMLACLPLTMVISAFF